MLRTGFLIAISSVPFLALAFTAPSQPILSGAPAVAPAPCPNDFDQEPLLIYDVSGYGLAGLIHQHVCVYDNGLVTYAEAGGGTPLFPFGSSADIAFVDLPTVQSFYKELIQLGAFTICDEQSFVADAPLITVTVFRGQTDSRAHTYSYYYPVSATNDVVHNHITTFIGNVFP
jgi:hypothetical protein